MTINILIADDHQIMREGLKSLIEKLDGLSVIGEAENGRTAVELSKKLAPDIVIVDIAMPDLNGIEAARKILADSPRIKVIALSMHSDKRFVSEMLKAGAAGYLLKNCAFDELARAIETVMANQIYLSPKIAGIVVENYIRADRPSERTVSAVLTVREREVLQLIAEGYSTKQIAFQLKVSVKTVETYRRLLMEKLDIHSIAELTKFAVREGLTSLDS